MGWDTPAGWRDPKEVAAAEETARRAESERERQDTQTAALTDAIRWAGAEMAFAIKQLAASVLAAAADNDQAELRFGGSTANHPLRGPIVMGRAGAPDRYVDQITDCTLGSDSDIDDLINSDQQ